MAMHIKCAKSPCLEEDIAWSIQAIILQRTSVLVCTKQKNRLQK